MIRLFFLFILFVIGSCGEFIQKKAPFVFYNDFETLWGWNNSQLPLHLGDAHSGVVCTKVDTLNRYAYGFFLKSEDFKLNYPFKRLRAEAWLKGLNTNTSAVLVLEITGQDGIGKVYEKKELNNLLQAKGKWEKVTFEFPLENSYSFDKGNLIKVYFWLPDQGDLLLIDDFQLSWLN